MSLYYIIIRNAELLVGEKTNAENFIAIKGVIDEVNEGLEPAGIEVKVIKNSTIGKYPKDL